jgi:hypothetical protein
MRAHAKGVAIFSPIHFGSYVNPSRYSSTDLETLTWTGAWETHERGEGWLSLRRRGLDLGGGYGSSSVRLRAAPRVRWARRYR